MKYFTLPRNIVKISNFPIRGNFENFGMNQFWKSMAEFYNVPFVDCICDTSDNKVGSPVQFNTLDNELQYFNIDTREWDNVITALSNQTLQQVTDTGATTNHLITTAGLNLTNNLQLSGSAGTSGQILASQGAGFPPHWINFVVTLSNNPPYIVASQAAMLATGAIVGDIAIRTDASTTYILSALPASTLGNWAQLLSPGAPVTSIFGRTGAVSATSGDYTFAQIGSKPTTLLGYTITDAVPKSTLNRKTTDYTLALIDVYTLVDMNLAVPNVITVPPNASVAFAIGDEIYISQYGIGETSIAAGVGVTINSQGGKYKLTGQFAGGALKKIGLNEWYAFGDLKL